MNPSQTRRLASIEKVMDRATAHASAIAQDEIHAAMRDFAKKLKHTTTLCFHCGMGTYGFTIKRAGKPNLWVGSQDTYYSESNSATFDLGRGSMVRDWTFPLVQVLEFLDKVNSDYRIWFAEFQVCGTRVKVAR